MRKILWKINHLRFEGGGVTRLKNFRFLISFRFKKTLYSSLFALPLAVSAQSALAYDACEAFLCFAGGKGVSECQGVIKDVLKDIAKGRPFPTCHFETGNGLLNKEAVQTEQSKIVVPRGRLCPDNSKPYLTMPSGSYCRVLKVKIDPAYAADSAHQTQEFYY